MSNRPASLLRLRVISRGKLLVSAEVEMVSLPGLDGEVGILPGHRPLILALGSGNLTYVHDGQEHSLPVRSGYATISPGEVIVFTELSQDEGRQSVAKQG